MNLNFIRQGTGPDLLILHGFLGSLDNWQTQARMLAEHFTVWTIDQRNHGRSPHTGQHSYELMAADLLQFCRDQGLHTFYLLGHSMGAKTAMYFAREHANFLTGLVLVDMGVKAYVGGHEKLLEALNELPVAELSSRTEADEKLAAKIHEPGVRQFLLKSLARNEPGGFRWRFNLDALTRNYDEVLKPFVTDTSIVVPTLFVRGGRSPYITDEDWDSIQSMFPRATLSTVERAGHWVHAEAINPFMETVSGFLKEHPR